MKTAIYIRVSTEEQVKEGYSISAQMKKLKAFCISQSWEVVGIYADEGISAKDMKRPQLQKMLGSIQKGEIECVLVYRLDRFTRSVRDLYDMLEILDKHNCKFKSATEVYDTTTAMGRMFITIVAALAQWERENMGERISFGMAEKAKQGKYTHNVEPLGYMLDRKESKLYINDKEAKIVKLIFDLYIGGLGFGGVAKELNNRNIYTKEGNRWTDITIAIIIKNHIYYGSFKWNNEISHNTHEEIITKDEWDHAQSLTIIRKSQSPRSVSSNYIFSGKLKCNNCNGTLNGYYVNYTDVNNKKKRYYNYRCVNKRYGICKKSRSVSETKLEAEFIKYLKDIDYIFYDEAAAATEKELNKNELKIDLVQLEKDLERIERRKKKWQYAWSEDVMTYDDFKKRMAESEKEESDIKKVLGEIVEVEAESIDEDEIMSVIKDIGMNWNQLNKMEKKNLVHSIIKEVHVKQTGNTLEVVGLDFQAI